MFYWISTFRAWLNLYVSPECRLIHDVLLFSFRTFLSIDHRYKVSNVSFSGNDSIELIFKNCNSLLEDQTHSKRYTPKYMKF